MPGVCKNCGKKFFNKPATCVREGHNFVMGRELTDSAGHCLHRVKLEIECREIGCQTETLTQTRVVDDGEAEQRLLRKNTLPIMILSRTLCVWCGQRFEDLLHLQRDHTGQYRAVEVPIDRLGAPPPPPPPPPPPII